MPTEALERDAATPSADLVRRLQVDLHYARTFLNYCAVTRTCVLEDERREQRYGGAGR